MSSIFAVGNSSSIVPHIDFEPTLDVRGGAPGYPLNLNVLPQTLPEISPPSLVPSLGFGGWSPPNLQSPGPGPQLNFSVPNQIYPLPKPSSVPLSLGQEIAANGLRHVIDQGLGSWAGWTNRLTKSIDVQRGLAEVRAQDPALPPGVVFGHKGEAMLMTGLRFGTGVFGNLLGNYADGGRTITNDEVGARALRTALLIPTHPGDTLDGIATHFGDWYRSPTPTEDKVADFASNVIPNPGWLGKAAGVLGGGLFGTIKLVRHDQIPNTIALSKDLLPEQADAFRRDFLSLPGGAKYVFDPSSQTLVISQVTHNSDGLPVLHPDLVAAIEAPPKSALGGFFHPHPLDVEMRRSDQMSTHLYEHWTLASTQEWRDFVKEMKLPVDHARVWVDDD